MNDEKIERVARAICQSRGIDPDVKMADQPPHLVYGGYVVIHEMLPAWRYFAGDAVAAIKALEEIIT